MLSFQHKLLQEYLAAIYIAENVKVDMGETFLTETFHSFQLMENHEEVLQFACGILADTDASPIVNHVAKHSVQYVQSEYNNGKQMLDFSILESCQKEGNLPGFNPYFSEYPACGLPLAVVLALTELAYITDINESDPLELKPSPAQIILNLRDTFRVGKTYDKLWQALHLVPKNVIGLRLSDVSDPNVYKLHEFSALKLLDIDNLDKIDIEDTLREDLTESINSWGPQPSLTYFRLTNFTITKSLLRALCKCTNPMYIELSFSHLNSINRHDCGENMSILMSSPPEKLRELILIHCNLRDPDVDHIARAIKQGKLTNLQRLILSINGLGKVAVGYLLEALISMRPHKQLELNLYGTEAEEYIQYSTQWKAKLAETNIHLKWKPWPY